MSRFAQCCTVVISGLYVKGCLKQIMLIFIRVRICFQDHHHHHLPYSTGYFFSVLRTGLYASSPEPHECHGNGNGQANIECYISLPLTPPPLRLSLTPHIPPYAFPSPLISPPPHPPP